LHLLGGEDEKGEEESIGRPEDEERQTGEEINQASEVIWNKMSDNELMTCLSQA
jgi:hypothetical protein